MSEKIDLVYGDGRTESVLIKQPTDTGILFFVTDENGERIQMLKIAPEGFFIRDSTESVAPENEAREVYEAFKRFLTLSNTTNVLLSGGTVRRGT